MELFEEVKELRRKFESRRETLEMWYQTCRDWKAGNETLEEIIMLDKYIQNLNEMENYLIRKDNRRWKQRI